MKMWLVGGSVATLLGVGFYLASGSRTQPAAPTVAPEVAVVVPAPIPPAELRPLDRVVDVSDLDSLLDPPPIPAWAPFKSGPVITRVGYDEPASPKPTGANVPPIPKSEPDEPRIIIHSEEEITRTEEEWKHPTADEETQHQHI